jgi:hypothetical protein
MNERFEPGEVAILQNCKDAYIGEEVTIVHGLGRYCHRSLDMRTGVLDEGYVVNLKGEDYFAFPTQLRKKKPPPIFDAWEFLEEITDGWNPTKVKA